MSVKSHFTTKRSGYSTPTKPLLGNNSLFCSSVVEQKQRPGPFWPNHVSHRSGGGGLLWAAVHGRRPSLSESLTRTSTTLFLVRTNSRSVLFQHWLDMCKQIKKQIRGEFIPLLCWRILKCTCMCREQVAHYQTWTWWLAFGAVPLFALLCEHDTFARERGCKQPVCSLSIRMRYKSFCNRQK